MRLAILFFAILFSNFSSGQKSETEIFLADFLAEYAPADNASYTNEISKKKLEHILWTLRNEIPGPNDNPRLFHFTEDELATPEERFVNNLGRGLPNKIDNTYTRIAAREIDGAFKDGYQSGWRYFSEHYSKIYFVISEPLFFRANSACLIFFVGHSREMMCPTASIALFLKEKASGKSIPKYYIGW